MAKPVGVKGEMTVFNCYGEDYFDFSPAKTCLFDKFFVISYRCEESLFVGVLLKVKDGI